MSVAVVIPTRDRPGALRQCLEAVRAQREAELDIVVVDDGGATGAAVVAALAGQFGACLVRLGGAGAAAARNAGVAATSRERILMLDDDCVPQPGWAAALLAATAAPLRVVAGTVVPPPTATTWLRASELIALSVETGSGFVRTLNLACHRSLLVRVPFDAEFPAAAGEDRDWCVRARRAGAIFVREPAAIVEHRGGLGARAFGSQQLRYGRAIRLLRRRGTHVPVSGAALLRCMSDGFREGFPVGVATVAAQALVAAGFVLSLRSDPAG